MSPLRNALAEYLTIRRSLGYQLYNQELLLTDFLAFLEQAGADRITIDLAVRWAKLPQHAKPIWWARRLGVVRGFARYMATTDPRTEVPPRDLLPARAQRLAPYIYSPGETQALMAAADALQPRLRGATHSTLIGMLAATGLRLGEALGLERQGECRRNRVSVAERISHAHENSQQDQSRRRCCCRGGAKRPQYRRAERGVSRVAGRPRSW
jgi:integrase/recombinase XerD